MPARNPHSLFKVDALAASKAVKDDNKFKSISSLERGDDAEVIVTFVDVRLPSPLRVRLLALHVENYPEPCGFMIFTDNEDAPKPVLDAMQEVQTYAADTPMSILDVTASLAKGLARGLGGRPGDDGGSQVEDSEMTDADDFGSDSSDVQILDDDDEFDDEAADMDEDDEYDSEDSGARLDGQPAEYAVRASGSLTEPERALQRRIRQSLRKAKDAGYRVGILGGLQPDSPQSLVSISIRVSKLGLPEEALQAWDLSKSEYLVLLVYITDDFPFLKPVLHRPAVMTSLRFRIMKCVRYKPTLPQAVAAFAESRKTANDSHGGGEAEEGGTAGDVSAPLNRILISKSLDHFMDQYFVSLLKMRANNGLSWDGANNSLLESMGADLDEELIVTSATNKGKGKGKGAACNVPDHLSESDEDPSVILIAMQFAQRYVVDCTKYCLRCHRPLKSGFESLKPYVCDNPLCLFQYVQMGLGPSVEHEILSQPKVVDLLVSFCYSSTLMQHGRWHTNWMSGAPSADTSYAIREFPCGLSLMVPDLFGNAKDKEREGLIKVEMDKDNAGAKFHPMDGNGRVMNAMKPGRWFVLFPASRIVKVSSTGDGAAAGPAASRRAMDVPPPGNSNSFILGSHAGVSFGTITDVDLESRRIGLWVAGQAGSLAAGNADFVAPKEKNMLLSFFDVDFDTLDVNSKAVAMRFVLSMLPPISTIRRYLEKNPNSTLRSMPALLPVAATLLEWIVATNRSLIFQIDKDDEVRPRPAGASALTSSATVFPPTPPTKANDTNPEMIPGMGGWTQFRFAQGAPDKEMRFISALADAMEEQPLQFPTIFAWHGSPLSNWHSIVRTGLDFRDTAHGRAYGNGIYFSQEFSVSQGYMSMGSGVSWESSELQISSAIALSEIINIPHKFISRNPHLVVQNVDWQQCRYLFVKGSGQDHLSRPAFLPSSNGAPASPAPATPALRKVDFVKQDPQMSVVGPTQQHLQIPLAAIPASRAVLHGASVREPTPSAPEADSEDEDEADAAYFGNSDGGAGSDDESSSGLEEISSWEYQQAAGTLRRQQEQEEQRQQQRWQRPDTVTAFEPGTLDLSSLQRLQPPEQAGGAGKHLTKELANLRKIQESTPPHELGWYVDLDRLENMFQIVAELHSFDLGTPLAQDMVRLGCSSVVLELRFPEDYPFSPPFVRVIRPRFLPFGSGGGGHVTIGGAMCMELLTSTGWSPAFSIESILIQVRLAICSTDPVPARLIMSGHGRGGSDYSVQEAVEAFLRAARTHGWTVPPNFMKLAHMPVAHG